MPCGGLDKSGTGRLAPSRPHRPTERRLAEAVQAAFDTRSAGTNKLE
jgi:hypothetical protein